MSRSLGRTFKTPWISVGDFDDPEEGQKLMVYGESSSTKNTHLISTKGGMRVYVREYVSQKSFETLYYSHNCKGKHHIILPSQY